MNTLLFEHNDDNNLNLKLNSDELAYLKTKMNINKLEKTRIYIDEVSLIYNTVIDNRNILVINYSNK